MVCIIGKDVAKIPLVTYYSFVPSFDETKPPLILITGCDREGGKMIERDQKLPQASTVFHTRFSYFKTLPISTPLVV